MYRRLYTQKDKVGKPIINQWGYTDGVYPEYEDHNMLTKSGVTILNKLNDLTVDDKHINYRYYISEANKIIADFVNQQLELF